MHNIQSNLTTILIYAIPVILIWLLVKAMVVKHIIREAIKEAIEELEQKKSNH